MSGGIIALIVVLVLAVLVLVKSITVIHQAEKGIVRLLHISRWTEVE